MNKLNNKGFAISTLLYGLMLVAFLIVSLLMSIMSTNRKNTSTLIKKIEEELNRYSQTATELTSIDGAQEFIVPYGKAGWYKIELWGAAAQGASTAIESSDKRGAYTSGVIYLEENQHLYFQIGSQGATSGSTNNIESANGAGGSTDVRLDGGAWSDDAGEETRIMIAAGGGKDSSKIGGGLRFLSSKENYFTRFNDGGSYISGYAGQESKTGYTFLNPVMYSGVNSGAGKAKIELISTADRTEPPAKKTSYLDNVRIIRDCINIQTTQTKEYWREIQAITANGTNVAKGKTVKFGNKNAETTVVSGVTDGSLKELTTSVTSAATGVKCVTVDLGAEYNLEEIVIFHNEPTKDAETAIYSSEEIILVNASGASKVVKSWSSSDSAPIETHEGVRISDRNPESINNATIPTGNYYIESAMSDHRVVSVSGGAVQLSLFTAGKTQKWSITRLDDAFYRILEGGDQMVLKPDNGAEDAASGDYNVTEYLSANSKYKAHPWEKWSVVGVDYPTLTNNGYYMFHSGAVDDWCIGLTETARNKSSLLVMKKCDKKDRTQWFKLVNADY